jgi:DNA-binding CsgD family transcriptional regulator
LVKLGLPGETANNRESMNLLDEKLLGALYEAPLEDAPWQGFISLLRQRLSLVCCHLYLHSPDADTPDRAVSDCSWEVRALLGHHDSRYHDQDPFKYGSMEVGWVYRWDDFVSREDLIESPFYRELARPLGFGFALCMSIEEPSGQRAWLWVARTEEQGDFSEGERVQFQRLFSHLQRSMKLLATLPHETAPTSITVGSRDIGSILFDDKGRPISVSDKAKSAAGNQNNFSINDSQLGLKDPEQQQQFTVLIDRLLQPGTQITAEVFSLGESDGKKHALLLRSLRADKAAVKPALILYLTDLATRRVTPEQLLPELFGLTTAETTLALGLAQGKSLTDVATAMQIPQSSARSYCKRIYAKTGLSRQVDLVDLMVKSVAALAST